MSLAFAVVVALTPTGVANASGHTLPKGTPYAAEVSVDITGTVQVNRSTTNRVEAVCEADPQSYSQQAAYHLRWQATFAHVTVPVATKAQLGKAFARLHVPVTPTSGGKGGLAGAGWAITGSGPTSGSSCDSAQYAESGTLTPDAGDPPSAAERNVTVDAGAGPINRMIFGFQLGSFSASTPAEVQDTPVTGLAFGAFKVFDTPPTDFLSNPPPTWNSLTLDLPPERFAPLLHQTNLTIPLADKGTEDCGSKTDPGISTFTCAQEHDFSYTVVLHRKLLYKSARAYPR